MFRSPPACLGMSALSLQSAQEGQDDQVEKRGGQSKLDGEEKKETHLLSVRPPDMLDGVSVFLCWGFMSWLTEGSLLTLP